MREQECDECDRRSFSISSSLLQVCLESCKGRWTKTHLSQTPKYRISVTQQLHLYGVFKVVEDHSHISVDLTHSTDKAGWEGIKPNTCSLILCVKRVYVMGKTELQLSDLWIIVLAVYPDPESHMSEYFRIAAPGQVCSVMLTRNILWSLFLQILQKLLVTQFSALHSCYTFSSSQTLTDLNREP